MSTLFEEDLDTTVKNTDKKILVVYNDNIHTFEFVIACLIRYCRHEQLQAEQCAHIIHFNGKCSVKEGSYAHLKSIHTALTDKGLIAKIE